MRMKCTALHWAVGVTFILFLVSPSTSISVRKSKEAKIKSKDEIDSTIILSRKGHSPVDYHSDEEEHVDGETYYIAKRVQNLTESKPEKPKKSSKVKEDSPINVDVIRPTDLGEEVAGVEEDVDDFNRELRGDKNPRIYYDDAVPRYPSHRQPHQHPTEESDFVGVIPEEKQKEDGKYYYPKNFMNSKYGQGQKKGHGHQHGIHGKRVPDHEGYNVGGHHHYLQEYPLNHDHSHPVLGPHHVEHDNGHSPVEHDTPYGVEEHGKGYKHLSVYGGYHFGGHRHTLGDKVDVVGKALRVLVPSALLITGVSALFPNRVHVPTTPNKYRQKRSLFRRHHRGLMVPPPPTTPIAHMQPEFEDVPTHILQAEHRIMNDGPEIDIYPEYGQRYAAASHSQFSSEFNPFGVFKGPGPERTAVKMEEGIRLPTFPDLPEMATLSEKNNYVQTRYKEGLEGSYELPPSTYGPNKVIPPTINTIPEETPTTQMSFNDDTMKNKQQQRRKTTRKPPIYIKESSKLPSIQISPETEKKQQQKYIAMNVLDNTKQGNNPVRAGEDFMNSMQNLVTPDVAKAIVENKHDPPKHVDLSPDGPVMGLLTSYAQHEKDSPICQKRALCDLAVRGKSPKATKFESFLWSVATLVPDVFSEMYDLQEVFQAIRDERCVRFECRSPNLDLQFAK